MQKLSKKKAYMLLKRRAQLKKSIASMEEAEKTFNATSPFLEPARKELQELERQLEDYGDFL